MSSIDKPDFHVSESDAAPAFGEVDRGRKTHRVHIGSDKDQIFRFDAIVISKERYSIVNFFNSIRVAIWKDDYIQVQGGEGNEPKVFLKVSNLARRLFMIEAEVRQMKADAGKDSILTALKARVKKLEKLLVKPKFREALERAREMYKGVLEKPALFIEFWSKYLQIFRNYNIENYWMIHPTTLCKLTMAAMEFLKGKPDSLSEGIVVDIEGVTYVLQEGQNKELHFFEYRGRRLGEGGFGTVEVVRSISHGTFQALKMAKINATEDQRETFNREVFFTNRLNTARVPGVQEPLRRIQVFGSIGVRGAVYQGSLESIIKKNLLTPDEKVDCCHQILRTLIKTHEANVFHHDINPENIFVRIEKQNGKRKITTYLSDFGVATDCYSKNIVGNPHYFTLRDFEAFTIDDEYGTVEIDKRQDFFGTAKTLIELIIGDSESDSFAVEPHKFGNIFYRLPTQLKEEAGLKLLAFAGSNEQKKALVHLLMTMSKNDPGQRGTSKDIQKYLDSNTT